MLLTAVSQISVLALWKTVIIHAPDWPLQPRYVFK